MDPARDVEGHKRVGKFDQTKTRPLVRFRESEKKKGALLRSKKPKNK